jgi:hypothetical protein
VLSGPQTEIVIGVLVAVLIGAMRIAYMRHRLGIALVLAPLLGIVALGVAIAADFVLDARDRRAFDKITRSDTEASIRNIFGKPDTIEPCGQNLWWGYDGNYMGKNDGRCVKWVRYNHFLSAWAVGYSVDGEVVSKYHYSSE